MSACERALEHAKNLGIEECESILSKQRITTVRITDSEIVEVKQNLENVLGVRIIHQKKIASAQTSILDEATKAVDQALKFAKFPKPKKYWKALPSEFKKNSQPENLFDKKLSEITGSQASDIAQAMINSALDQKISTISGSINIVSERFEVANSNGLSCNDDATYIAGVINADSEIGDSPVSGFSQSSCRMLASFHPETIGEDARQMCINSINPQKCEEGTYSLIFEPYAMGEILAFVIADNFDLKTYAEKLSCFSEKIEKKIAVENFNLMDDPHAPDGIGSKIFDDEGMPTKPRPLIENGVFKNLYSDLYNAFKENKEPSGNARRPASPMGRSAEPIPYPAPHNLRIIANGMTQDEMIKDTKKGLLVGRLWYTYPVNPIKGDFSCTARSGIRIIENGQIKNPGKSFRIVHNLPTLLQNISAIGNNETNVQQWASLPSITPSVKAEGIKIVPI